jgi:hypothetical protein
VAALASSRVRLWLFWLATGAVALAQGLRVKADPDLWWHVRTGELILAERSLPRVDPFSFTATGAAWTNHEWLSDVLFAALFRAGRGEALTLLRFAVIATICGLLAWLLLRRARVPALSLAILAAYFPFLSGLLNVRPHSFTYLLTLAVLAVLEGGRTRPALFYLLPAVIALWANLHGGFLLGVVVALIGLGAHLTGAEHPPRTAVGAPPARWAWLLASVLLAPLLTPHGTRMVSYLWAELGADHATVSEWKRLTELPALWPAYLAMVLPPLGLLLWRPRRARLTETILFLGSAVLAYRHLRFLAPLAIFSSLVMATALGAWWQERHDREATPALLERPAWLAALTALLVLWAAPRWISDWQRKGLALEVDPRLSPILATRFLAEHDLGPNLATRLDWGGYAIYHLWPRYKVSLDGRNVTVYPGDFVAAQIAAYDGGAPLAGLGSFRVDAALVESAGPGFEGMQRQPGWALVFRDPLSAVFLPRERAEALARGAPEPVSYQLEGRVPAFP